MKILVDRLIEEIEKFEASLYVHVSYPDTNTISLVPLEVELQVQVGDADGPQTDTIKIHKKDYDKVQKMLDEHTFVSVLAFPLVEKTYRYESTVDEIKEILLELL